MGVGDQSGEGRNDGLAAEARVRRAIEALGIEGRVGSQVVAEATGQVEAAAAAVRRIRDAFPEPGSLPAPPARGAE